MLAFLPIDLPKVPYDEKHYWNFFDNTFKKGVLRWNTTVIRRNRYADKTGIKDAAIKYVRNGQWYWTDQVLSELPLLVEMIESLPFRYISYVSLMSNHETVPPHKDSVRKYENSPVVQSGSGHPYDWEGYNYLQTEYEHESSLNEPSNYRILLCGERNKSFFVCRDKDLTDKTYCSLPIETDTFAFNNNECFHGADLPPSRKLLVFISAWLDFDKHKKVIDKSLAKYKNQAVIL